MTRTGSYLAMNRMGMHDCSSPFLQMSFETTATFLTKAAQEGASDAQQSPSARIVLGNIIKSLSILISTSLHKQYPSARIVLGNILFCPS